MVSGAALAPTTKYRRAALFLLTVIAAAAIAPSFAMAACVNASTGEGVDCSAPGAVDEAIFNDAGPTGVTTDVSTSSDDGSGGGGVIVAIAVGAAAVLGVGAFIALRRRRSASDSSGDPEVAALTEQVPQEASSSPRDERDPQAISNEPQPPPTEEQEPALISQPENEAPAQVVAPAADAGWYPDPTQPVTVRYWDGSGWTDQRAPMPTDYVVPGSPARAEESKGWRLTTLIISLVLSLGLLLQSCAVAVGGSLSESLSTSASDKQEAQDLSGAGGIGVLAALLWVVGAGFVLSKPKVSIVLFVVAALFCVAGAAAGFSDLYIWAGASALFALSSWAGSREQARAKT